MSNGTISTTEAGLDALITQGNYSIYFTGAGANFADGSVWLLEVRKVYFHSSGVGYVQRMTQVYPGGLASKVRTYYSATGWGIWV